MANTRRAWYSGMATTEDWWAVWLGLTFFGLGLLLPEVGCKTVFLGLDDHFFPHLSGLVYRPPCLFCRISG